MQKKLPYIKTKSKLEAEKTALQIWWKQFAETNLCDNWQRAHMANLLSKVDTKLKKLINDNANNNF